MIAGRRWRRGCGQSRVGQGVGGGAVEEDRAEVQAQVEDGRALGGQGAGGLAVAAAGFQDAHARRDARQALPGAGRQARPGLGEGQGVFQVKGAVEGGQAGQGCGLHAE